MLALGLLPVLAPQSSVKERIADQVYHHAGGAAFTYEVAKPQKPNGIAMVWMVSGGWVSEHKDINPGLAEMVCKKGVTLFQVVHGAQPRYKMGEILDQVHRAVKHIRTNSQKWGIDPQKIGVSGGSAGGHLSLMIATQGAVPTGSDVLLKTSSEVQSVAVLYPPTDFLNWGATGVAAFKNPLLRGAFGGTFAIDNTTSEEKLTAISQQYSPIRFTSAKTPPTLLIHGDKDVLVPIQQSQIFKAKLDELGVKSQLITVPGEGHGWKDMVPQLEQMIDWHVKNLN